MKRTILGLIAALTLSACGGKNIEEMCREICECEQGPGCRTQDFRGCLFETNEQARLAESLGCTREFHRLVNCIASGQCVSGRYNYVCANEFVVLERCDNRVTGHDSPPASSPHDF